ncbi:MAG: hypothetical protein JXQ75_23720 [Phycisphaerae bacterium]|nr:hypothetical protein [Phycisphaerae bacterium]
MRTLTKVLDAVQRLVDQREDAGEDDGSDTGKPHAEALSATLHLLDVKSKSAAYAVASPDQPDAIKTLSDVGASINAPDGAEWTSPTLSSLEALSQSAKSLGCEIEFREPGRHGAYGGVIARITPMTYSEVCTSAFIFGRTSVYARIERVGGATAMHCGIRLPDSPRKMVICRVANNELVRELGRHMYDHCILSGNATWVKHNWKLRTLVIDAFEPPKTGSVMDALRRAHDAGGYAWDAVADPEKAIAEMRRS